MNILLTGATGFIGTHLRQALLAQGHRLVCPARRAGPQHPRCHWITADFGSPHSLPWAAWLADVDAAVNAVGIFREQRAAGFETLHTQLPLALFRACVQAGVRRVLQVSALGATAQAPEAFLRSKHAADEQLLALPLDATVVLPALVFGSQGASSRQLLMLASMPLLLLPAGGLQAVQPVHVDDVVAALCRLLQAAPGLWHGRRVALVGPQPLALHAYLRALRRGLGLDDAAAWAVPSGLMAAAAPIAERLPVALLSRDAWHMLQRGQAASADAITALLQRPPRAVDEFIAPGQAEGLRLRAQLAWLLPLLRLALALLWIATAIVSMGVFPVDDSLALLQRAGVPAGWRPLALQGAAALDLLLGLLTLWPQRRRAWRRWLWAAQAALVLGYTAIITLRLPEFWLHPYGPMTKNLPLLALLLLLWTLDRPSR